MSKLILVSTKDFPKSHKMTNSDGIELPKLAKSLIESSRSLFNYDDDAQQYISDEYFGGKVLNEEDVDRVHIAEFFPTDEYWEAWIKDPKGKFTVRKVESESGDVVLISPCFNEKAFSDRLKRTQDYIGRIILEYVESQKKTDSPFEVFILAHEKDLFKEETFRCIKPDELINDSTLSILVGQNKPGISVRRERVYGFQHSLATCEVYNKLINPLIENKLSLEVFIQEVDAFFSGSAELRYTSLKGKTAELYQRLY